MRGRKKLNKQEKRNNIILLVLLCILILLLIILTIKKMFLVNNYYDIESRVKNVEKMKAKETDDYSIKGWIRVQGTEIDYPLIGLKNKEAKMPVEIDKYAWIMPGDNKYHNVINIQGHNIMNLGPSPTLHDDSFTRFEELMDFVYFDFAKENKYIQLTMDGKEYLYQIFAVGFIDSYTFTTLPINEYTSSELQNYLDTVNKNSIYDYNVKINDDDKFITLATCTRFFGETSDDFYVAGRLVKDKERINNYSVRRNKNYEEVASILKGDAENDTEES